MATTIKNATLKVTVKEEITLIGNRQDSENVLRISDILNIFSESCLEPFKTISSLTVTFNVAFLIVVAIYSPKFLVHSTP